MTKSKCQRGRSRLRLRKSECCCAAAKVKVEVRGWRFEAKKVKAQSSNRAIYGRAEKRALSANYIFSTTTPRPPGGKSPVLG